MKYGLKYEVIEKMQAVFWRYSEIEKVILYGSRAKGTYKKGSDIDLTIKGDRIDLTLLFKIENELDDLFLPYKIDLSIYNSIQNPDLLDHIERVGKEFFIRKNLKKNEMADQQTNKPASVKELFKKTQEEQQQQ